MELISGASTTERAGERPCPPFVSAVGAEQMDTVRVAVYARQSKARPDSSEASPEAQTAAGEALAASRGWEVVHAFKDVGRSGWDPNAVRPAFEDLMSAVRAGEVDAVVVNELSRLTRKGAHDARRSTRSSRSTASASSPYSNRSSTRRIRSASRSSR
ncbi:recombinase family protein [Streptomyces sp. NPDC017254]|uniref:recombinase family protein n=1 Tax=unclassified Streptomyces TaxID=2593676 RepID=UPI0037A891EC